MDRRRIVRHGVTRSRDSSRNTSPTPGVSPADRDDLQQRLAQFGEHPAIQNLLARAIEGAGAGGRTPDRASRDGGRGPDPREGPAVGVDRSARRARWRPATPKSPRTSSRSFARRPLQRTRRPLCTPRCCAWAATARERSRFAWMRLPPWRRASSPMRMCSTSCGPAWNRRSRRRFVPPPHAAVEKARLDAGPADAPWRRRSRPPDRSSFRACCARSPRAATSGRGSR